MKRIQKLDEIANRHPETKLSLIFGEVLAMSNRKKITAKDKIALAYFAVSGLIEVSRLCKLIRGK